MAVEEVNLQHGQGGRLRGRRHHSATDMGVEKAAPGRPTDQATLRAAGTNAARLEELHVAAAWRQHHLGLR